MGIVCVKSSGARMADPNPTLDHILAALAGAQRVIDIGCGNGALAGALARRGYKVTGLDPQADRIAQARETYPAAQFAVATAESLPLSSDPLPFDAAVFLNALHHVPEPLMTAALTRSVAALRGGGVLVVVEPLAEGSFFEAMRPVDDETVIRAAALRALGTLPEHGTCRLIAHHRFDRPSHFTDLEGFLTYLRAADPARAELIERHRAAVAEAFSRHATPQGAGFALVQPMAIWVFQSAG